MAYNQYEHKGVDKFPLSRAWYNIPRDEDGDVPCSYCSSTISLGGLFWAYRYQGETKVRCETCITKLKAGSEVKEGYDYTIVDLFRYRKAAELHMRILYGDKGGARSSTEAFLKDPHLTITRKMGRHNFSKQDGYQIAECYRPFLPKLSMTMVFRLGETYKGEVEGKQGRRRSNPPFGNKGRIYVYEESWYKKYLQKVIKGKLQGLVKNPIEDKKSWLSGNLLKADLQLAPEGLVIKVGI